MSMRAAHVESGCVSGPCGSDSFHLRQPRKRKRLCIAGLREARPGGSNIAIPVAQSSSDTFRRRVVFGFSAFFTWPP